VAGLLLVLLLPLYESTLAGLGAVTLICAVGYGFLLHPKRDVLYVHTKTKFVDHDKNVYKEHDLLAVRVEVTRLWLLFLPTFLGVTFLVVTAANGTTWNISILSRVMNAEGTSSYILLMMCRMVLVGTVLILTIWIGERRVFRDAYATSAMNASVKDGRVGYVFLDLSRSYYGGESLHIGLVHPASVARLVFYRPHDPALNKIAMSLLFHSVTVIGRGLTDLDEETVDAHAWETQEGLA
jgi:hypothetical protein